MKPIVDLEDLVHFICAVWNCVPPF